MSISTKYLYDFHAETYKNLMDRTLDKKENLIIQTVDEGYLLPIRKSSKCLMGAGGVVDNSLNFVDLSAIISRAGMISYPKKEDREYETYVGFGYEFDTDDIEYCDEEIVYLGFIRNHWGHFLIDFSTRLWYALKNKNKQYVFIVDEGVNLSLHKNICRFLELCGIGKSNVRFINKTTKFRKIIVPECSYVTNDYYSDEYTGVFEHVAASISTQGINYDKVYFARNMYRSAMNREIGEKQIIEAFKLNGFHIISPEKCTLDEQVEIINNAKCIAGVSGSVVHNLLFATASLNAIIINKTYVKNVVQCDVNCIKNYTVTYVDSFETYLPVTMGVGPFILKYNDKLKMLLSDLKFQLPNDVPQIEKKNRKRYKKLYKEILLTQYRTIPNCNDENSVHFFYPELTMNFDQSMALDNLNDSFIVKKYCIKMKVKRLKNKIAEKAFAVLRIK